MKNIYEKLAVFKFAALFTLGIACSTTPPVNELPVTADLSQEIIRCETDVNKAIDDQVNILAPENFSLAVENLSKAKAARDKDKGQKAVLHRISVARAYLTKATEVASVSRQLLPKVVEERHNATVAGAQKYFQREFDVVDGKLFELTRDIEAGDTSNASKMRDSLSNRYNELEYSAIKKTRIGDALATVEQAKKEGAEKLAPQTLAWANQKISQDEAMIAKDRHNVATLDTASKEATASAARLLLMTRQAKNASAQTPEEIASRMEKEKITEGAITGQLDQTKTELNSQKADTALLAKDNQKLQVTEDTEKKFEFARSQFSPNEAEVYKQGGNILLRLKGLNFDNNKSVIGSENYALLGKVEKVITNTGPSAVTVEGHTDSTGSKLVNERLSTERAKAVESYLVHNSVLDSGKISAEGFGDSKPIASNKSKNGRAQNRRVDIILNTTQQ